MPYSSESFIFLNSVILFFTDDLTLKLGLNGRINYEYY